MKQVHYTFSVLNHRAHFIDVTITITNPESSQLVQLPVWTPGSYLVREYARHVRDVYAQQSGIPCVVQKIDKRTWQIAANGDTVLEVHYRVYAYELSVRTNHVDDSHAFFNPAAVCMQVVGAHEPLDVTVIVPHGWHVATQLLQRDAVVPNLSGDKWSFVAPDYDALVDAPFECGTHRYYTFYVERIPHHIAIWGHGNEHIATLLIDIERSVRAVMAHFAHVPYQQYLFILHLADGAYGGLEHAASTVCLCDKWGFGKQRDYERILGLITHEFYHTWNVKYIRPAPLGPFDYGQENYTRQLWLVEGVTSYYDNLIMCRAGMITPQRYLELLADDIATVQRMPGRHVQSLAEASFDAWIRFYRPDENSPNVSISYYIKGALVVFALDMLIRQVTNGTHSFDDVMRYLEAHYPWQNPGIPEGDTMQQIIATVIGGHRENIDTFFADYIYGTQELDYASICATVGLYPHWHNGDDPVTSLGVVVRQEGGRLVIATVSPEGPAYRAGISPFDELVALNGVRVDQYRLKARLNELQVGSDVVVTYFRRDELRQQTIQVIETPLQHVSLLPLMHQTDAQLQGYQQWIHMPQSRGKSDGNNIVG
ncbi:MAG: M61 family metallopeptidase [Roseiflexaceae bacterium]